MSYEGYTEFICEHGHYSVDEADYRLEETCPICLCKRVAYHDVDETNGYVEGAPDHTSPAPKTYIGFVDVPMVDHRGNHYVTKRDLFAPIYTPTLWRRLPLR